MCRGEAVRCNHIYSNITIQDILPFNVIWSVKNALEVQVVLYIHLYVHSPFTLKVGRREYVQHIIRSCKLYTSARQHLKVHGGVMYGTTSLSSRPASLTFLQAFSCLKLEDFFICKFEIKKNWIFSHLHISSFFKSKFCIDIKFANPYIYWSLT